MPSFKHLLRSLTYYWRTHLAVVWGVAMAVSVLTGALLVGDSVRASLRDLFLTRLGATDQLITAPVFFREQLAGELASSGDGIEAACPLIALEGLVTHEPSGRRSSGIQIYGVDERFWQFHGISNPPRLTEREVLLTAALADELGSTAGDTILLRVGRPSDVPEGSLHRRREDVGQTFRLTSREWPAESPLTEFALYPTQGAIRAAFLPLERLQRDLDRPNRANAVLVAQKGPATEQSPYMETRLRESFELEDLGVKLRRLEKARAISVESESILIGQALTDAAREAAERSNLRSALVYTYLASSMRIGDREIPYSLVSALDTNGFERLGVSPPSTDPIDPIVLNDWALRDLGASPGDRLIMDYYFWLESGRLTTRSVELEVADSVPLAGPAADPDWAPAYPGISESDRVSNWDPPFPVDYDRIRPADEDYWEGHRTTPKAFIPLVVGQKLWGNRYGNATSVRVYGPEGEVPNTETYRETLRDELDPFQMGFSVYPARAEGLRASRGATDFGEYFSYFSFFLMVSSLMLTGLFFRLGVEQRLREVGILHAMGFPPRRVRALFLGEGAVLAVVGSLAGMAGAVVYGHLIMLGLKTWWVDAVGTRLLTLHVSWTTLVLGSLSGVAAALMAIAWTLRSLQPVTPRGLLAGAKLEADTPGTRTRRSFYLGTASLLLGLGLVLAAAAGWMSEVGGFFGAGSLLMVALLCYQWARLHRKSGTLLPGGASRALWRLGLRNASYRPGRSLLTIALIAFSSFIIVAVDAFRRDGGHELSYDKKSGTGGFPLLGESLLPLYYDPNTTEGKEALNLPYGGDSPLDDAILVPLRLRPGDDTSCLNLYRPSNPRILAAPPTLIESGRFAFQASLADSPEQSDNPWLLLEEELVDGAVPVIGDANSMAYVLHLKLGDDLLIERQAKPPLRLRLVATLADSLFQRELVMSEDNFRHLFPEEEGYRFFLLDVEPEKAEALTTVLEQRLTDFGFDVVPTNDRIADFHRVENTYLSTFQALGGLGLILGTLGLAAVMMRNILERRKELALLRAVGYNEQHFAVMVVAENALLLFGGVLIGTISALVAIAPALISRGGGFSLPSVGVLLLAVLGSGLVASVAAVKASVRSPLLESLRSE